MFVEVRKKNPFGWIEYDCVIFNEFPGSISAREAENLHTEEYIWMLKNYEQEMEKYISSSWIEVHR